MSGAALPCQDDCDKRLAVRLWLDTVAESGLAAKVIADAAGMKEQYYSKVANGEQGDLLGMIYRVGMSYPDLRRDFICRLAEAEHADPIERAAEQLARASIRYLRLRGERPLRMATVATAADRKRRPA